MSDVLSGMLSESWYVREVTRGVTPTSPVFQKVRSTGGMPSLIQDQIQSEELESSREITDISTGNISVTGEYTIELSYSSHDDLLAGAMSSSWTSGSTIAGIDTTVDDSALTYTRATGDFLADGITVGALVGFNNLTGNNAIPFHATAVTATTITGAGIRHKLTAESATTDYSIADKSETGKECGSFSLYTTLTSMCGGTVLHFMATGVEFSGWSLDTAISSKITGSLPFIGSDMVLLDAEPAGATKLETSSTPFDNKDSSVLVDGVLVGGITTITYTNDNNASPQYELNKDGVGFIERSRATNTISASMFMRDAAMFTRYKNNTPISTSVVFYRAGSGAFSISTPVTKITETTMENSAESNTQSISATATGNKNQSSIILQRLPNM